MSYNPTDIKLEEGAYIVVTHQCNRGCSFCSDAYRNNQKSEFLHPFDVMFVIVPKLLSFGIRRVTIVGGEPFLSPHIELILQMLHPYFEVVVSTNSDFPEKMRAVSKYVDHWNFSMYGDKEPPFLPGELQGDITLSKLIHAKSLSTIELLDDYIAKYQAKGYALKFSTLSMANQWCKENKEVSYLDSLGLITTAFNGVVSGQWYKGCFIDRKDIPPQYFKQPKPSLKVKPNGTFDFSWKE